jgi:aldose 1-epimerase
MTLQSTEFEGSAFLTLANNVGLAVTLSDFGAAIYEITYQGAPMTIAEKDKAAWKKSDAYFGKTAGRVAGRIPDAKLNYLGKDYSLEPNEGKNTLHGGPHGFSFRPFKMDVVRLNEGVAVDFYLLSPKLDGGFPGEVSLRVRYLLYENKPILKILYQSKVSEQTPLNVTNHSYFNLGGEATIEHQRLFIDSQESETYDATLIPLGFRPSPSCLDFSLPKEIGRDIQDPELYRVRTKGYDHAFLFKENDRQNPVVSLESAHFKMEIVTSYPVVQIYSHNYPHLGEALTNGHPAVLHSGVAIEPVYQPNDFHTMTVLPYEGRKNFIEYRFSSKE